jgi:hypothetical protein
MLILTGDSRRYRTATRVEPVPPDGEGAGGGLHQRAGRRRRRPSSLAEGQAADPEMPACAAAKAKAGSARLRLALLRYGAKHGLPNLSPEECLSTLRVLRKKPRGRRPATTSGEGEKHGARG